MSGHAADRNLLFGIFAYQMEFLTRDQLVEGMGAWVLEKSRPLEDILVEKGHLAASDRDLLLPLIARHIEQHEGDPEKSLKAISSLSPSLEVLSQIEDGDLQESIKGLRLSQRAAEGDFPSTVIFKPNESARYLSLRPHAKGGLGEVFVALDTELDREVALKEMQEHHARDRGSRSRFLMEAEVTGKLNTRASFPCMASDNTPTAARFMRCGSFAGIPCITPSMSFTSIKRRAIPTNRSPSAGSWGGLWMSVMPSVMPTAEAFLHRDLKPGNIMLGKFGETLVVDWGLAKVKGREPSSPDAEVTLQISSGSGTDQTLPGSAIGTPGYMSPEQAEGNVSSLGPATDIYGLGATLYTLLSGKKPIEAQTIHETVRRTAQGDVPKPSEINSHIPKPLEAICLKAMALFAEGTLFDPAKPWPRMWNASWRMNPSRPTRSRSRPEPPASPANIPASFGPRRRRDCSWLSARCCFSSSRRDRRPNATCGTPAPKRTWRRWCRT